VLRDKATSARTIHRDNRISATSFGKRFRISTARPDGRKAVINNLIDGRDSGPLRQHLLRGPFFRPLPTIRRSILNRNIFQDRGL